jgi:hypothetical protein
MGNYETPRGRFTRRDDTGMRAPRMIPHITVTYSCGCYANLPLISRGSPTNAPGDSYCGKHGQAVTVVARTDSYVIRCLDCKMRPRYYGAARMTALVYATRHSVRHAHRVAVYCGETLVETTGTTTRQLMLGEDA